MFKFLKRLREAWRVADEYQDAVKPTIMGHLHEIEPPDHTPPKYEGQKGVPELWMDCRYGWDDLVVVYPDESVEAFSSSGIWRSWPLHPNVCQWKAILTFLGYIK